MGQVGLECVPPSLSTGDLPMKPLKIPVRLPSIYWFQFERIHINVHKFRAGVQTVGVDLVGTVINATYSEFHGRSLRQALPADSESLTGQKCDSNRLFYERL